MALTTPETSAVEFFKARLRFLTTPPEVRSGLRNGTVVVLDVRDREEFAEDHIPGAINVPLDELENGFRVQELIGGIEGWRKRIRP